MLTVFFGGLLACLILSIGAMQAQAADNLFQVTGVAQNDVLNIRAEPNPTAEKIGSLPYNAISVKAVGEIRATGSSQWRQIQVDDQTGWVNINFLTPQKPPLTEDPVFFSEPLNCSGTEPFWAFQVNGKQGELDTLSDGGTRILFDTIRTAEARPTVWILRGRQQSTDASTVAMLEKTNICSDGMSDLTYRYSLRLDVADGPFYAGCCNALSAPAP